MYISKCILAWALSAPLAIVTIALPASTPASIPGDTVNSTILASRPHQDGFPKTVQYRNNHVLSERAPRAGEKYYGPYGDMNTMWDGFLKVYDPYGVGRRTVRSRSGQYLWTSGLNTCLGVAATMKPRGTSEKWHILAHVDPQYDWQNHWKDQLANIQAAFNEAKRLGIKPKNVKLVLDKGDVENDPNKDMLFSSSKKTWAQMLYYFYDFMEQELSAMMSPDKVNYALHGISERGEADFNQPPLSTMVIFGDSVITAEDLVV